MACGDEYFSCSGPKHLTSIDWKNANHRRTVAASLVKGVYTLEGDRQARRRDPQSLAPPWWEFFHFKLILPLVDKDNSIFGTIFEYKPHRSNDKSPRYVIAFRGTLIKPETFLRDIKMNILILLNELQITTRFEIALKAVRDVIPTNTTGKVSDVWLTGHSQGAATAMLTGKLMAKQGKFLEAYLFNPPYVSLPVEGIKAEIVKDGLLFAGTLIKVGVACAAAACDLIHNNNSKSVKGIGAISEWIPHLFVNGIDPICSGYISSFKHRKKLENVGAGAIAKIAGSYALGHLVAGLPLGLMRKKGIENSEPLYLLPSVSLTVNLNPPQHCLSAHWLNHWWMRDLNLTCNVYKCK